VRSIFWPVQGVLGFAIAFALAAALEFGLIVFLSELFDVRLIPRGFGWIVLLLAAGWFGWQIGSRTGVEGLFQMARLRLDRAQRLARFWLAGSVLWALSCLLYLLVADPYGYSVSDGD
jgi:hypothetical protein